MKTISPYIIPPILSLLTAYSLSAMALVRGRIRFENILFALICISWTLPSSAFVFHYLMTDEKTLMSIERTVHTFYVLMPALSVLFFQAVTDQKNRYIVTAFFLTGIVISATVHTDYYFYAFYVYDWGRIARGGPAFAFFYIYGLIATLYIMLLFANKYRKENNSVIRLKISYLFLAYFLSAILSFTNLPSMYGIDFYSLGNFTFIPLGILTYGILRHRVMEISSILHISVFWFMLSSIIVLPNMAIFVVMREYFFSINILKLSLIFIAWFLLNYVYFIHIQPLINQLFNQISYNLGNIENNFSRDISQLKSLEELAIQLTSVLKKSLNIEKVQLLCRRGYMNCYTDFTGCILEIPAELQGIMLKQDYLEKSLIESAVEHDAEDLQILPLFDKTGSEYIVPMIHRNELIAILCMSQKKDLKRLNDREFEFITKLNSYAFIAVANSVMYQDLSDIKDNLEKMVAERTSIIESQKAEMERDIELARKIQIALLPGHIPHLPQIDIAFRYEPVMKVGGDFIDIHYREGMNELGLFICDVSGHGAGSAMISSMVKMSLNSWGKFINSPGKAFVEMRNMLYGKMGDNFITACMCCVNLETGVVTSANAGHPPMLIAREDGRIEVVNSGGKIIVDYAGSDYEENVSKLEKGDKLLLYTDGVIEVRNNEWEFGENRFHKIIRDSIKLSAEGMCGMIYEGIALKGGILSIDDDFAVLVAEYRGG